MLTLGLIEGVLSATVGILFLVGAMNENAPLHRIFGPLVALTVGVAAYGIHEAGVVGGAGDAVGLLGFAFIAFFAPVGVMRWAWKSTKSLTGEKPVTATVAARSSAAAAPAERTDSPARAA